MRKGQSCRSCTHYGVPPGKIARGDAQYPCNWKMPDTYIFPEAITSNYNSPVARLSDPKHHMGYRTGNDGTSCPTYKQKEKPDAAVQG
jgi:hypothetical protein